MIIRSLILTSFLILPLNAQDTTGTGSLGGQILLPGDVAVAGAKVCVVGGSRCAESGVTGEFLIPELRPGTVDLEITLAGRPALAQPGVEIRAGITNRLQIVIPALDALKQEVTVAESASVAPEEVKSSSFLIQPVEVYKSAGALQDVSRYLQTLPGVVFGADDFRNDIVVRGGSPLENLYVVDNVEIPNINSFASFASAGGVVSMLDAALLQDVSFLSGGYPAPYVNRLSSVLQVTQREGDRTRFRGRLTAGFAGAGGIVEGPVGRSRKGSFVASVRRSFLDLFTDDIGFGGVPVNYSYNVKALYDLTPNDRIWVVNVSGNDRVRIRPDGADEDQRDNIYNINYDGWRSATGINWQRLFGARGVGLLGVTHSEANLKARLENQLRNNLNIYNENNREGESTVKYDLTLYTPMLDKIQAGGNFKVFRIRYLTEQPFGFDNPLAPGPGANPFFLDARYRAYQSSGYFQSTRDMGSRLSLTWGGRVDNYSYIGATRFSPRTGLTYRLTNRLAWRASYGQYYQQPFFFFLSAFPVNRGLTPARSDHYITGFSYTVSPTFRITLEGYRKYYRDYAVSLEYPTFTLANTGDTFAVNNILFPLTSAGRGRAEGVELFMEKKFTNRWFGQANLSWARSYHAALDGVMRRGSFDSPILANAVGGYRFNSKWEISMRAIYLTGRPYTPLNEAESFAQNRAVLDTSRATGVRAGDYARFDFRLDRTFTVRDKPLLVFIGLQNAFDRRNFQAVSWNRRDNGPVVQRQLGLFPLIGMDWRF